MILLGNVNLAFVKNLGVCFYFVWKHEMVSLEKGLSAVELSF